MNKITVTNLMTMSFADILDGLSVFYTKDIEKSAIYDENSLDFLADNLRRLTNYYAYLTELYNYAVHYTRNAPKEVKSDMMDKRDAIEHIIKSVDVKIKTVSRMITVHELRTKGQQTSVDGHINRNSGWGMPK